MSNKYKIIELFLYALIMLVGLALLITGKVREQELSKPNATPQASIQQGGSYHAVIPDNRG